MRKTALAGLAVAAACAACLVARLAAAQVGAAQVGPGSYEARTAEVRRLAAEARLDPAIEAAAALARDFPEDPAAHVLHGWALLRAGRLAEARAAYSAARRIAPANPDAAAGLAAVAQAETAGTKPVRSWFVAPSVHAIGQYHAAHPLRRWSAGVAAALEAGAADRVRLAAVYRFLYVGGTRGRGSDFDQHEAWGWLGWQQARFGVSAFGAYSHWAPARAGGTGGAGKGNAGGAQSILGDWSPDAGAVGGVVRVAAWADFVAGVAHSFYDDFGVTQATADAWLPVVSWLVLRGGFEVQVGDGTAYPSGVATVRFHGAAWSFDVEGRFGPRRRPLDLAESSMYNLETDRLDFGARAAATFPLGARARGSVSYDLEGFRTPMSVALAIPETVSTAHRLTIGAGWTF